MTTERLVFIISDLHIGGAYPKDPSTGDRGFRLCTNVPKLAEFVGALDARSRAGADVELLINGDFIDFLAETEQDGTFSPFRRDPDQAVKLLNQIIAQDQVLFDALKRLLEGGATLTLLLGNHDVELSFPAVRKRLEQALGVSGQSRFRFLYDGEALVIGDALIEHGNRYDPWNQVDHDQLRRLRSIQSRLQPAPEDFKFDPPAGSRLVATVMNPVKRDYPFVDLLKPEQETMLPILLALEPGARSHITKLVPLMASTTNRGVTKDDPSMPAQLGNISSVTADGPEDAAFSPSGATWSRKKAKTPDERLDEVMNRLVGKDHAGAPKAEIEDAPMLGDISFRSSVESGWSRAKSLVSLLVAPKNSETPAPLDDKRVRDLQAALRAWQSHGSFDEGTETTPAYLEAARKLAQPNRIRYVVFGHTHLAKRVELKDDDVVYLNSGTWGDLMRLPDEVLADTPESTTALTAFLDALRARDYTRYLYFRPTFVRLTVGADDRVSKADLVLYTNPDSV